MFHCALVLFAVEVRQGFELYKFKSKDAIYHTADSNLKKEGERILFLPPRTKALASTFATTLSGRTSALPGTLMAMQR